MIGIQKQPTFSQKFIGSIGSGATLASAACKEIIYSHKSEIESHVRESNDKFRYYTEHYIVASLVNPMMDAFCSNGFYSSAIITIISHPFLTSDAKVLVDKIIDGAKLAILGPLLAYALIESLPSSYTILTTYLINNLIRNLVIRILFLSRNKSVFTLTPLLPAILLTGAIRGIIFYNFCFYLKKDGFNYNDIFFFSMIIKNIFEPQIKKYETIDISLRILNIFNQKSFNYKFNEMA
jgi:hypothetical protein